jgi:hypothetical protein
VELQRILEKHDGLSTPSQFIRTPDADPQQIEELISAAQQVFSQINARRNARLAEITGAAPSSDRRSLCVVAPSQFRLWNDLGPMMRGIFDSPGELRAAFFDCDDPCNSSPLALIDAVRRCGAILTANTARTDMPSLAPDATPWITWVTGARIPSSALRGDADHLIVVSEPLRQQAIRAGWPAAQVHLGGFPASAPRDRSRAQHLGIIADTYPLDTPKDLFDFSSHALLWEGIRHELRLKPLALTDPAQFLAERMKRLGVSDEGFPFSRFVERLILPAYQQGIARMLATAKLPLRIFGHGWDALEEFRGVAAGPIVGREGFDAALADCRALMHVWPGASAHAAEAAGVPLIRVAGKTPDAFVAAVRQQMQTVAAAPGIPPLSAAGIASLLLK